MSTAKRSASRTGKKKTTPSKDVPAKKRGEGSRVSFSYVSFSLVQVHWTEQGFPYINWCPSFLRSCDWRHFPIQDQPRQIHLLPQGSRPISLHQEPKGNWRFFRLRHIGPLRQEIRRSPHHPQNRRCHQSPQSHPQTIQPLETVQRQHLLQQLMGPLLHWQKVSPSRDRRPRWRQWKHPLRLFRKALQLRKARSRHSR